MKLQTARISLAVYWIVVSLLFISALIWISDDFPDDAPEVLKKGAALVTPMMGLALAFLFGGLRPNPARIESIWQYVIAVFVSVLHVALLVKLVFFQGTEPYYERLSNAGLPIGIVSGVTILILNYFFLGRAATAEELEGPA